MSETISKSELAAALKLSRARISQLVKDGLPVQPDGRLNRVEALQWCKDHQRPHSGGWGPNGRASRQRAKTGPKARRTVPVEPALSDYESLSDYGRGAVDMSNYLREPANLAVFAELAAAHGCTAAQSYGVAQAVGVFIGVWTGDLAASMLSKPADETRVVEVFADEPVWAGLAAVTGEAIDLEAWKAANRRAMQAWGKRAAKYQPSASTELAVRPPA